MVQLLINSSSCANQAAETPCNTGQANYICSGAPNYQCITKCEFKSFQDTGYHWTCGRALETDIKVTGLCPGDSDNVCVRGAEK